MADPQGAAAPAPAPDMPDPFRLAVAVPAAAAGGSALGAGLFVLPSLLPGTLDTAWFAAGAIVLVSLPFTLAGSLFLAGLTVLLRHSLSRSWSDYVGIVLAALPVGALIPVPLFGAAGILVGALFALITALVWAALYRSFVLPTGIRELDTHG